MVATLLYLDQSHPKAIIFRQIKKKEMRLKMQVKNRMHKVQLWMKNPRYCQQKKKKRK